MGRPKRAAEGGYVYHVLNRANTRLKTFEKDGDYEAFERILEEAVERFEMRLLAYCLMPTHWHLVLWPHADGLLSRFTGWLTLTHTQRWHAHYHSIGQGHLYQGRFKSFPVEENEHFLTLCRYVERNALRAEYVERAEQWQWSSLWRWKFGNAAQQALLSSWPVRRSPGWIEHVNQPLTEGKLAAIRQSVGRGNPSGSVGWCEQTIERLDLHSTIRPIGRPKKPRNGS